MRLTSPKYAPTSATVIRTAAVALLLAGPASHADSTPSDLDDIRRTLESVEQDIVRHGEDRDETSRQLNEIEQDINNRMTRRRAVSQRMAEERAQFESLQEELQVAQDDLNQNADAVRSLLRNMYAQGQTQELKLLLGDADPVRMGRSLVWYRYVANARSDEINGLRERINQISKLKASMNASEKAHAELAKRLDEDTEYLDTRRRNKAKMLASINTDLKSKQDRAESLRKAESLRLREIQAIATQAKLREELARDKAERAALARRDEKPGDEKATPSKKAKAPFVPEPGSKGFSMRRGTLPFPVDGEIGARFGERKSAGSVQTWKGILIHATEGEPVRAVADGVVEATSNRPPFGPTIYLVHDDGFVTAYMHNSELVKERGDRVTAGEVIAYVGSSGLDRPGLFFLIANANAGYVDPLKWLKTR